MICPNSSHHQELTLSHTSVSLAFHTRPEQFLNINWNTNILDLKSSSTADLRLLHGSPYKSFSGFLTYNIADATGSNRSIRWNFLNQYCCLSRSDWYFLKTLGIHLGWCTTHKVCYVGCAGTLVARHAAVLQYCVRIQHLTSLQRTARSKVGCHLGRRCALGCPLRNRRNSKVYSNGSTTNQRN